ncbi:MAG TPA: 1,2-phenylacetyl-CoA epoxidase subunit PaaC [Gemmatimonadaceae bacterium]|nr:1,2-phenylacetyl-CoA epoxidase subunit PaaC [Gemmatimonadaceae bacterium]
MTAVAGTRRRAVENPAFEFVVRLGDDRLVLGHRLSEWCGHGPILEEDIALANIALDLIGHSTSLLRLAGELEAKDRDEDALAYFREGVEYRNALLCELPKGDFGFTIMRQFLFDAHSVLLWEALTRAAVDNPANAPSLAAGLSAIAAKALKEDKYHLRHTSEWVVRLGDGTDESHARAQSALDALWPYTAELFDVDEVDQAAAGAGVAVDMPAIRSRWDAMVSETLARATLTRPADGPVQRGGRRGRHTEHLGHMLTEMQIVARSHPGAKW